MKKDILDLLFDINQHGYEAYLVGGFVRDYILGNGQNNDIDIATNAPTSFLLELFKDYKPKCFKYETIKFKYNEYNIDIAHFRKEEFHDDSLSVLLVDNLFDDSFRRDFSINSIYMDKNEFVYFFKSSYEDRITQTIKFIKRIDDSLLEDPSRMLRYIYFILKYNFKYVESEFEYISENGKRIIENVDQNIIQKYLNKISKECNFELSIGILKRLNIYTNLFGNLSTSGINSWSEFLKQSNS